MNIVKCKKCGSTKLVLKHVDNETRPSVWDSVLFWSLGVITLGLYFIFWAFAERKTRELGTEYYECQNCNHKMKFEKETVEEPKKKEEVDEKELEEIREIGKNPVNIETWRSEREEAVQKRRKEMQNKEKSVEKNEKIEKND